MQGLLRNRARSRIVDGTAQLWRPWIERQIMSMGRCLVWQACIYIKAILRTLLTNLTTKDHCKELFVPLELDITVGVNQSCFRQLIIELLLV